MAKHSSDLLSCSCGKRFRSYAAEAYHRHNFPALCRGNEQKLQQAMGNFILRIAREKREKEHPHHGPRELLERD